MPAFTATTIPAPHPVTSPAGPIAARALGLNHYRPTPCTLVVSVRGDVDASNAGDLLARVRDAIGSCDGLVLDLSGVEFFGAEGLSVLRHLGKTTSRTAVVPSPAVTRLLALCTPAPRTLLASDLGAALVAVQSNRPVLQLVAEAQLSGRSYPR